MTRKNPLLACYIAAGLIGKSRPWQQSAEASSASAYHNSTTVLTARTIACLMSVLRIDRDRLKDIETQILHLERSLAALHSEQRLLQERLNTYTYPVLTLPNELVLEIFAHVLPPYPYCPPVTGEDSPNFLAHISCNYPAICVLPSSKGLIHILDIWLERSRDRPLSITVKGYNASISRQIFSALAVHRSRWEELRLIRPNSEFFSALDGPLPLLRLLEVELSDSKGFALPSMPRLRTTSLNCVAGLYLSLPWTQLTSLSLEYVSPEECVTILRRAPNLVVCQLALSVWRNIDAGMPDIVLPNLESLLFCDFKLFEKPHAGYLDTFVVAGLRTLCIPHRFLGTNPVDSLASFIRKSGCGLQEVHVEGIGIGDREKDAFRVAFPSISQFIFDGCD
ncbi:hypothetical protein DFH06DRAFT_1397728 [Mycena polygramma]|nr:hypothetical protein DFH06DRAFT_1397728 [Mycena polygramma]